MSQNNLTDDSQLDSRESTAHVAAIAAEDEACTVASIPAMLADTRSFPVGTVILTRSGCHSYEVVSSDPDLTTAGGTYLRALWRDGGFDIRQMGAKSNGVAEDTAAIQRACDRAVGEGVNVVLPPETVLL